MSREPGITNESDILKRGSHQADIDAGGMTVTGVKKRLQYYSYTLLPGGPGWYRGNTRITDPADGEWIYRSAIRQGGYNFCYWMGPLPPGPFTEPKPPNYFFVRTNENRTESIFKMLSTDNLRKPVWIDAVMPKENITFINTLLAAGKARIDARKVETNAAHAARMQKREKVVALHQAGQAAYDAAVVKASSNGHAPEESAAEEAAREADLRAIEGYGTRPFYPKNSEGGRRRSRRRPTKKHRKSRKQRKI